MSHLFTKIIMALICMTSLMLGQHSLAQSDESIYIKLGEAKIKKSLIAFPQIKFAGNTAVTTNHQRMLTELYQVIYNDLNVMGYFQFIDPKAFLEDPAKTSHLPAPGDPRGFKFESWNSIGADFLLRANFSVIGEQITLETFTYHVPKGSLALGKSYKSTANNLRTVAHTFANDLLLALTGQSGMFLSKVVVASDKAGSRAKEIYTMDWDGNNPQRITQHHTISLSPAWSPDRSKVAYTSFIKKSKKAARNADLLMLDLLTGKRWIVSYKPGQNSGAAFHPDGKSIFLTISGEGNPDIYQITLDGSRIGKITNGPRGAMNVEPAISPDGKKIAFSSDRSGRPMIYTMNLDGSNIQRLTYAGRYNSSPSWSPDGKRIVFAGWEKDHFDIFIINTDGTNLQRIVQAPKVGGGWSNNEDPVFSPDGRLIMYTSNRTGKNQLYVSTINGSDERRITYDNHNYFRPKWQ